MIGPRGLMRPHEQRSFLRVCPDLSPKGAAGGRPPATRSDSSAPKDIGTMVRCHRDKSPFHISKTKTQALHLTGRASQCQDPHVAAGPRLRRVRTCVTAGRVQTEKAGLPRPQ
jgi:hypothetical protein